MDDEEVSQRKIQGSHHCSWYEQMGGEHFDSSDKVSSVVNDITIRIIFTLIVMASFWTEIVDH
jgi:hypothetical protein